MLHAAVAAALSKDCRDLLVEHIDGSAPIGYINGLASKTRSRQALLDRRLIHYHGAQKYPTRTMINEDGRTVLAHVLASYADALIRAGFTGIGTAPGSTTRNRIATLLDTFLPPSTDR